MGNCRMESHLEAKEYRWVCVDKRSKHGGLGFMIRKDIQAERMKIKDSRVLWVKLIGECPVFIGGIYRSPASSVGDFLRNLKNDIARLQQVGLVIVIGDFNARVGNTPSVLNLEDHESNFEERVVIQRTTEDKQRKRSGFEVMNTMDALNMVVLNGVREKAEFTCRQEAGSSVIDLVCVDYRALNRVHKSGTKTGL